MPGVESSLVCPLAVAREVNGQHLPAVGADNFSEGLSLLFSAALSMDEQPDILRCGAIHHGWNMADFKFFRKR